MPAQVRAIRLGVCVGGVGVHACMCVCRRVHGNL